ncbi:MAG: RidA family protein [Chloroflexi bacterium]|nr:MAG: RidA family protein [Chloroflexota bacterium]TMG26592.1 MAG: RidA family protein [Chloroflexota bacterium]
MQPAGRSRNINPDELPPARGYSHATVVGDTVWIGGQIGSDATGKVVEPGDIVAQYGRAIHNVAIALRAAGFTPDDTVKLTYYVTDIKAYRDSRAGLGAAYREFFRSDYPASTLVEVRSLVDPDALIEIDAVAVRQR